MRMERVQNKSEPRFTAKYELFESHDSTRGPGLLMRCFPSSIGVPRGHLATYFRVLHQLAYHYNSVANPYSS